VRRSWEFNEVEVVLWWVQQPLVARNEWRRWWWVQNLLVGRNEWRR